MLQWQWTNNKRVKNISFGKIYKVNYVSVKYNNLFTRAEKTNSSEYFRYYPLAGWASMRVHCDIPWVTSRCMNINFSLYFFSRYYFLLIKIWLHFARALEYDARGALDIRAGWGAKQTCSGCRGTRQYISKSIFRDSKLKIYYNVHNNKKKNKKKNYKTIPMKRKPSCVCNSRTGCSIRIWNSKSV